MAQVLPWDAQCFVGITEKDLENPVIIFAKFLLTLVLIHCFHKSRTDESGRKRKDGYAQYTH